MLFYSVQSCVFKKKINTIGLTLFCDLTSLCVYAMLGYCQLFEIKNNQYRVASNSQFSLKALDFFQSLIIQMIGQTSVVSPTCLHFVYIMQRTHNNYLLGEGIYDLH